MADRLFLGSITFASFFGASSNGFRSASDILPRWPVRCVRAGVRGVGMCACACVRACAHAWVFVCVCGARACRAGVARCACVSRVHVRQCGCKQVRWDVVTRSSSSLLLHSRPTFNQRAASVSYLLRCLLEENRAGSGEDSLYQACQEGAPLDPSWLQQNVVPEREL